MGDKDEKARIHDVYNKMLRDQMNAITNTQVGAINSQGGLYGGSPMQNAAQNMYPGAILSGTPFRSDSWFDHNKQSHFNVIKVDNGFVIRVGAKEGAQFRTLVASSVEEVRDLITAEMVSNKMEK